MKLVNENFMNEQITKVHGRFVCSRPRTSLNRHGKSIVSICENSTAYQSQGEGDQPSLHGTEHSAAGTKTSLKEILGKREPLRRVTAYSNTFEKHIQLLVVQLM